MTLKKTYRISETIRGTTLNQKDSNFQTKTILDGCSIKNSQMFFDTDDRLFEKSKRLNLTSFFEWFIGFLEGDGHTKIYQNQFAFLIVQKELAILIYIRKILGFGKFRVRKDGYGVLRFRQEESSKLFLFILWGNLITRKKQIDFNKIYQKLQSNSKFQKQIQKKNIPFTREVFPSLTTGWLSGIIDSDGGLCITQRKNRFSPRFRIYIDQNERLMLEKIASMLSQHHLAKGTIYERKDQPGNYRLTYQSRDMIEKVFLPYFTIFPLRTKKKFQLISYRRILHKNLHLQMSQIELKHDMKLFLKRIKPSESIIE